MSDKKGKIVQVIGPVLDVQFDENSLPEVYDALEIYNENGEKTVAEVQQLLGENTVRSVAMSSTDGLKRGMEVIYINDFAAYRRTLSRVDLSLCVSSYCEKRIFSMIFSYAESTNFS